MDAQLQKKNIGKPLPAATRKKRFDIRIRKNLKINSFMALICKEKFDLMVVFYSFTLVANVTANNKTIRAKLSVYGYFIMNRL